ncbi:GNAT family N-acetyltransferase [Saccharobesus litoralis]|uniref:L-ornithine N(alpha)-acyltransferase n=1 Tax=Saccharobesus litoralis TaxID=2172099 RepID=A0A2S0VRL3_9ALTE|nr:lysophospholipid acyltransferase family protein [Saccharobesus litoralis]AWB66848.1 GNAT family N-acetyltransferase [Saccharobesus litoralis]
MFSVDQVIKQTYPQLEQRPMFGSIAKRVLRGLLHEKDFVEFGEQYPHLTGLDFVEQVLEKFEFTYTIRDKELERIPATGRCVIIANHPIGTLDGLALIKLVSEVRKDFKVVANQVLMAIEPLHSLLLPVNNMNGGTPKENIQRIQDYLSNEGVVIIFPAGEVSRLGPSGVKDGDWRGGFLRMATAAQAPILPIYVNGKNSPLFYGLSAICKPLSTMLLVKEMFKQQSKTLPMRIGELIPYESYRSLPVSNKEKVRIFRRHLYRIAKKKKPLFVTQSAIAHPEPRQELKTAIEECEHIGATADNKQIYLYQYQGSSPIMREIGRLREVAFRAVGEGSGLRRDVDRYDSYYEHLILWDANDLEIVGAYRLGDTARILANGNKLYTETLFNYQHGMQKYFDQGLELGRSFVQPRYWGKRSLDYLWYGIGAYLVKNPQIRYMFGPVSISDALPKAAKDLLVYFYNLHFSDDSVELARSKIPYDLPKDFAENIQAQITGQDYKADFMALKDLLANMGCNVPTLYKQYSEVCEPGGVQFLDFNVDPDFNDCVDGLVLVDTQMLKAKKRARYMAGAADL